MARKGNRYDEWELHGSAVPTPDEAGGLIGTRVDDMHGAPIGRLVGVSHASETEPAWLVVSQDSGDDRCVLIPLEEASLGSRRIWVRFHREFVRGAPTIKWGERLTAGQHRSLARHYGLPASQAV